jgi:hypothetical protein
MKSDENKIRKLSPGLAMAFGGEPGECARADGGSGMAEVDELVIEESLMGSFRGGSNHSTTSATISYHRLTVRSSR